jgi:hypothetical protein
MSRRCSVRFCMQHFSFVRSFPVSLQAPSFVRCSCTPTFCIIRVLHTRTREPHIHPHAPTYVFVIPRLSSIYPPAAVIISRCAFSIPTHASRHYTFAYRKTIYLLLLLLLLLLFVLVCIGGCGYLPSQRICARRRIVSWFEVCDGR